MTEHPLSNITVIEIARILAGPWAGQTLADLGARVIKVESPQGDDTRKWGPPFIHSKTGEKNAAYFHCCNRGKDSVIVDFNNKKSVAKLIKLIETADVLIENFKVGGLVKYGLDYDSLKKVNPRLIYCSITGFGQDGPYANKPGYDFIIQAMAGIMELTGEKNREPQKIGVAFADIFAALYSVIAIQAALAQRKYSQKGQHIDIALFDSMTAVLANQAMNYLTGGISPTRNGNRHPNIAPYQTFPTKDANIVITAGNNRQFKDLCKILKIEKIADNPLYRENQDRVQNIDALSETLTDETVQWQSEELLQKLEQVKVPASRINNIAQVFADPQFCYRRMKITPEGISGIRSPIKMSEAKLKTDKASPCLGSATAAILGDSDH